MSNASSPFRARVVPIIKILDGSQSEPVEGRSGKTYGWTGQGDTAERCTVFPHKQTTPAQVEQWLKDVAGGALDDIFQVPFRRFGAYVPTFRLELLGHDPDADPVMIVEGVEYSFAEFYDENGVGYKALTAWLSKKGLAETSQAPPASPLPTHIECGLDPNNMPEVPIGDGIAPPDGPVMDMSPTVDESVTPSAPDTLPAAESTKEAAESAAAVDVDRDEMGNVIGDGEKANDVAAVDVPADSPGVPQVETAAAPRGRGRPPKAK